MRLVFESEKIDMTPEELKQIMERDFIEDSQGDGSVDKLEFRYAVFQVADQWTSGIEAEEYVEFLKRGFDIVFRELVEKGKTVVLPLALRNELKNVKGITPMPCGRTFDIMNAIIEEKVKTSKQLREKGKHGQIESMDEHIVQFFKIK